MKLLFFCALTYLFCIKCQAQKPTKIKFNSYNSLGFITGKLPISFAAQTENGVSYKNWFLGAGFGVDDYYLKTLPLFIAVKREFSFKKSYLFLYVNSGGQFMVKDKKVKSGSSSILTKAGFYGDAGLGCKIKTTKNNSVYFSMGNTIKNITQTENSIDYLGMPGISEYKRKLSRLAFRIGYQF